MIKLSDLPEVYLFSARVNISWFSDQNTSWKGIYCPWEPFRVQLQVRHQWQSKASLSSFDNRGFRGGSLTPERYLTRLYSFSHLHSLTYRSLSPVRVLKYSWPCSQCHLRISKWEAQGRRKSSYYEILRSSTNVKAVIYKPHCISSLPLTVTILTLVFPLQNSYGEQTWLITQNGNLQSLLFFFT